MNSQEIQGADLRFLRDVIFENKNRSIACKNLDTEANKKLQAKDSCGTVPFPKLQGRGQPPASTQL